LNFITDLSFTRNIATFPARDFQLFKKQLFSWAGNFFSCVCFDSNDYAEFHPHRRLFAAAGEIEIMPAHDGVFSSLKKFFDQQPDWLFGFFSYDLKNETEPKIFPQADSRFDGIQFPAGYFFRPKHIVEVSDDTVVIHSTENPKEIFESIVNTAVHEFSPPENKKLQHRISRSEYIKIVRAIKEHIAQGDLYEMNFCQEFFVKDISINPASLFSKLNEISPSPFSCFVKHDEKFLLCASPERFLKKERRKIFSQPMKGTIRRSEGVGESEGDKKLIEVLRNDPKERAENVMIVDLVRNDLARSAVPGSVKADELFGVYTFPQVHQMISTISATLRDDVHFVDAIKHAFPMGSMTGAPKVMAMQLIDRYEKVKRGLFSGSVGSISPEGDFDFNVVIRSLFYNASSNYLSFQTGSAITHESIPEKEYEECLLKAKAIMQALQIHEGAVNF